MSIISNILGTRPAPADETAKPDPVMEGVVSYLTSPRTAPTDEHEEYSYDITGDPAPYGEHAFGLTRFGDFWLPMAQLESVCFNPPDGCGAEVLIAGQTYHLDDQEAVSLFRYLMDAATTRVP